MKILARELGPRRISVNAVAPGPTDTSMVSKLSRDTAPAVTPFGRLGTPDVSPAPWRCSRRPTRRGLTDKFSVRMAAWHSLSTPDVGGAQDDITSGLCAGGLRARSSGSAWTDVNARAILYDLTPSRSRPAWRCRRGNNAQNVWEINYTWGLKHKGVGRMTDRDLALREIRQFNECGGGSIVELSNHGMKPDPTGLRDVAERSGVQIIMGCGQYVDVFLSPDVRDRSVDAMAADMVDAIEVGVGGTDVRAGIIGEIGCSLPWTASERRAIQAASIAQRQTGAAITVHPGRIAGATFEIVECVRQAGGDVSRLIIGHIDRTIADTSTVLRLADCGCVIEYDLFGIETTFFPFSDFCLPNDGMRLDAI